MTDFDRAEQFNDDGNRLRVVGDIFGAEAAYRAAASAAPQWSVPVYNLGLIYKYDGRWQESLACNQQAAISTRTTKPVGGISESQPPLLATGAKHDAHGRLVASMSRPVMGRPNSTGVIHLCALTRTVKRRSFGLGVSIRLAPALSACRFPRRHSIGVTSSSPMVRKKDSELSTAAPILYSTCFSCSRPQDSELSSSTLRQRNQKRLMPSKHALTIVAVQRKTGAPSLQCYVPNVVSGPHTNTRRELRLRHIRIGDSQLEITRTRRRSLISGWLIMRAPKSRRGMKPRFLTNFATDVGLRSTRCAATLPCVPFNT